MSETNEKSAAPGVVGPILERISPEREYLRLVNEAFRAGCITEDESIVHAGEVQSLIDRKLREADGQ